MLQQASAVDTAHCWPSSVVDTGSFVLQTDKCSQHPDLWHGATATCHDWRMLQLLA